MSTLKEAAEEYTPQQVKNIAELEFVDLSVNFEKVTREKADGTTYDLNLIRVDGEEYRVPNSVLDEINAILIANPNSKRVKVVKKGEGLKTSYKVVSID